jgi:hypothetical protein
MSKSPRFTKDQPRDGDTILHCGHLGRSEVVQYAAHWFKFDGSLRFERPDGSSGEAEWFAACEPCFIKHGEKVSSHVRGDGVWTGDAPAIEKVEN